MWPLWLLLFAAPATFDAKLREGLVALQKEDLALAQANLEQATRLQPGSARAWLALAQAYGRLHKEPQARQAAAKAERLGQNDAVVLRGLASFYTQTVPDPGKAAGFEQRYAALDSGDKDAYTRAALLYWQAGRFADVVPAARKAMAIADTPALHTLLAKTYAAQEQWDQSAAELNAVIRLRPYDEASYFDLAQLYLARQDFPNALAALDRGRQVFDKSPQLELARGVALYGQRRFPEAVEAFLRTIQLEPDVPQPYSFLSRILEHAQTRLPEIVNLAAAYRARHAQDPLGYVLQAKALIAGLPPAGFPAEATQAQQLLEQSLNRKEDDADAHYELGCLLERKRDFGAAATHLERSIALQERRPDPHYHLARVYDRLGRKPDADRERALHAQYTEAEKSGMAPRSNPLVPVAPAIK